MPSNDCQGQKNDKILSFSKTSSDSDDKHGTTTQSYSESETSSDCYEIYTKLTSKNQTPASDNSHTVPLNFPTPDHILEERPQKEIIVQDKSTGGQTPSSSAFLSGDFNSEFTESAGTTESDDLHLQALKMNSPNLDLNPIDALPPKYVLEDDTLLASCNSPCCTQGLPCHPTINELKETSVKQARSDGQFRQCPVSVFSKFPWATYCMTHGTIACFHCKKAINRKLITFS